MVILVNLICFSKIDLTGPEVHVVEQWILNPPVAGSNPVWATIFYIMKVLYSETYEREGNDSWLIDKIQVIREDGEIYLRHKINHKGWGGDIKETYTVELEEYDTIENWQKKVDNYMSAQILIPEMKVPNLKEILNDD
jgi:hypothetical protein